MKTLMLFCLCLVSSVALAQRVEVSGTINVPEGEDPEGITIYNATGNIGTISDSAGEFDIVVAEGDTLQFSALQFQDFSVVVDEGVVDSRQLNVFISEAIKELPEVVVTPYDLSGNVRVDVRIIPTQDVDLPTQTAAEINPYEWEFRPDSLESPPNAAMRAAMIYDGANIANIFRHIVTKGNVMHDIEREDELNEKLLELRDDNFYEEQLNIEDDQLREFIFFAADNGLTREMLEPENEMELIEFLVAQSQKFNQMKAQE